MTLSAGDESQLAVFNAAYQSLVLGHQEAARAYFEQCLEQGLNSPLAHVGLILSNIGLGQSEAQAERERASRECLAALQLDSPITPQEERYLDAFSLLLAGSKAQAAERFVQLAEQYRADMGLSLWAIQLLHDGYDEEGVPTVVQKRAIEMADALLERYADNALVLFMRALVEENAPEVSDAALAAAKRAVEMLPEEAQAGLLYAHLLVRRGEREAGLKELIAVEDKASAWQRKNDLHWRENSIWVRARLYHITLLEQMGRLNQSSLMLKDTLLRRLPRSMKYVGEPVTLAEMLYGWEMKTLEMRLLIARGGVVKNVVIERMMKEAMAGKLDASFVGFENYVRCLRACLEAGSYHRGGDDLKAQESLQKAIQLREDLGKKWENGFYTIRSHTMRAGEACDIALNLLRCEMFDSTRDLWEEKLRREMRRSSLLMPVVVPVQAR